MKWLLRLLFIRLLGKRALAVLSVMGIIAAVRSTRAEQDRSIDPRVGR
jgi:hypothetical protein